LTLFLTTLFFLLSSSFLLKFKKCTLANGVDRLWANVRMKNSWICIHAGLVIVHVVAPGYLETTDLQEAYSNDDRSNIIVHHDTRPVGLALGA